MKPIFQKKLQFGDIWPRNRQQITQIDVFGHFMDFASLVFLYFARNDRWSWCLVVFLQFAVQINVILFVLESNSDQNTLSKYPQYFSTENISANIYESGSFTKFDKMNPDTSFMDDAIKSNLEKSFFNPNKVKPYLQGRYTIFRETLCSTCQYSRYSTLF